MPEFENPADNDIRTLVKELMEDKLGLYENKIEANSRFVEDLGVDSLDMIELQMEIEKKFSISIQDEELEKITTVSDLISLIREKKTIK